MEKDYLKVYLSGEIHSDWRDVIKKSFRNEASNKLVITSHRPFCK